MSSILNENLANKAHFARLREDRGLKVSYQESRTDLIHQYHTLNLTQNLPGG